MSEKRIITVETTVAAPLDKVWELWTSPDHIIHWNFASEDWCCPSAENDLQAGGVFIYRMEARDGSMGFDFGGRYEEVLHQELLSYYLDDGRSVSVSFKEIDGKVEIKESFEAENTHSEEQQKAGWQSILENFKKYVTA